MEKFDADKQNGKEIRSMSEYRYFEYEWEKRDAEKEIYGLFAGDQTSGKAYGLSYDDTSGIKKGYGESVRFRRAGKKEKEAANALYRKIFPGLNLTL